ncbi:MAG: hypothetical protein J5755_05410, partial [Clostridia bacterium]|nr:hypothetical protein [Clostridia bacterium]
GDPVNYGALKDKDGNTIQVIREVGSYTFSCVVSNQQFTVVIRVDPIQVTLQWDVDSLACEYGQTPHPQARVADNSADVPLVYHRVGEETFSYSEVNSYTIICEATGNYSGSISGTYVVSPCTASISVTTPPQETVVWDGAYYVKTRFGVTVSEGYDLLPLDKVKVVVNGSVVNSGVINAVGDYTVSFAFDDNNPGNFAEANFNATATYDLSIVRAPLSLVYDAGGMGVPYSPNPSYPQLVYDAFANDTVRFVSGGNKVEGLDNSLLNIVYLDQDKEPLEGVPTEVGEYFVRVSYPETPTYQAAQAVDVPFYITRADISSSIVVKVDGVAVPVRTPKEFDYGAGFVYSFTFPEVYAALADQAVAKYQRETEDGEWENVDGVPQVPGSYRYQVTLTDANVYADTSRAFSILKATMGDKTLAELGLETLTFTYGDAIVVSPDLADYEEDGHWVIMYEGDAYPRQAATPRNVGEYNLILTLEGDSFYVYNQSFVGALVIQPKPITLTAVDKPVAYGNAWAGTSLQEGRDVTWQAGAVESGDEDALLAALNLVARDADGNVYTEPVSSMVAGNRYDLVIVGEHPNYDVTVVEGALNIGRRSLTVAADSLTVYKSSRERDLTLTLTNVAPWDDEEELAACFAVKIANDVEWSEAVAQVTNRSIAYDLEAYKAHDSAALANYNPSFRAGKLTVRPTTLVTNDSDFGVEGQFSQE